MNDAQQLRPVEKVVNAVAQLQPVEMPLENSFHHGVYIRTIFMPKGAFVVSRKHLTEHPFTVSKGKAEVWGENGPSVMIEAPYSGITKPGTRRYLLIHEDCVWTTFHQTDLTDPDEIVQAVTEKEDFALCIPDGAQKRLDIWKKEET